MTETPVRMRVPEDVIPNLPPEQAAKIQRLPDGSAYLVVAHAVRMIDARFVSEKWDDVRPYVVETDPEQVKAWHKILRRHKRKMWRECGRTLPRHVGKFWASTVRSKLIKTIPDIPKPVEKAVSGKVPGKPRGKKPKKKIVPGGISPAMHSEIARAMFEGKS
jgi:hypothetical protein